MYRGLGEHPLIYFSFDYFREGRLKGGPLGRHRLFSPRRDRGGLAGPMNSGAFAHSKTQRALRPLTVAPVSHPKIRETIGSFEARAWSRRVSCGLRLEPPDARRRTLSPRELCAWGYLVEHHTVGVHDSPTNGGPLPSDTLPWGPAER